MKKGLMVQFPCARGRKYVCKNIGDYIQAIATRQFVNPIDLYIEQEEANNYFPKDREKTKLIMNGWFQWRSENWPPSVYIYPLLISMHISPIKAEELLKPEGIAFLNKYGPVGCRDYYTKNLLESKGIPAYFSACMTLTLGEKYSVPSEKHKGICFVDPFFEIPDVIDKRTGNKKLNIRNLFHGIWYCICFAPVIVKLGKKQFFKVFSPTGFLDRSTSKLRPYYKAALFYKTYRKKFDRDMILNADYITHWMDVKMDGSITNDDLLNIAEDLVKKYASSSMVVTSRIHAALPCLGVDTPVCFIANEEVVSESGTFNTPGRLGGLLEFFRILTLKNNTFETDDELFKNIKKFSMKTHFKNKDNWKPYASELKRKVINFMDESVDEIL